jgi:hypothetical protein
MKIAASIFNRANFLIQGNYMSNNNNLVLEATAADGDTLFRELYEVIYDPKYGQMSLFETLGVLRVLESKLIQDEAGK